MNPLQTSPLPRFLIFERDTPSYHCGLIRDGIRQYFREGDHKLTFLPFGMFDLDLLCQSQAHSQIAMISWFQKESNIAHVRNQGIPFLNLHESAEMSNIGLRLVFEGEGRVAADFFIREMNYESLAFVGMDEPLSHKRRWKEYEAEARNHSVSVESLFLRGKASRTSSPYVHDKKRTAERADLLTSLLRQLTKPAGIFCANDHIALHLYYLAQHLEMQIPEEISILGVGSLTGAEQGGVQSISVVQLDHVRHGHIAAEMIEHRLSGQPHQTTVTLSPEGIVHRSTTARRAVGDPLVQRAFQIIDNNRGITVEELSQQLSTTRRKLDLHFQNATNMSAARAIDYERFQKARQLLKSKRFSHDAIAGLAGYSSQKQMIRSFDRLVQMSPKQFCRTYLQTPGKTLAP